MIRQYRLGRHVEPTHDPRSWNFQAERATAIQTVTHVHVGPVLDQGDLGSCTGNAMAQALNTYPLYDGRGKLQTEKDAVAIYSWATFHDPVPGHYPPKDTGSDGLSVAKAAMALGLITGYTHAFGLQHGLESLTLRPVLFGTVFTEDMFTPDKNGFVRPTGSIAGGHEYLGIGINVEEQYVEFLNSWGPDWGLGGVFRMRFGDVDKLLKQRGDIVVPVTLKG